MLSFNGCVQIMLLATKIEKERIEKAYKSCFYTFHDLICGVAIKEGMDTALAEYDYAVTEANDIINDSILTIAKNIDTWVEGVDNIGKTQDFFIWKQGEFACR